MSSITASSKSKRKISSVAIYTLGCKLNFSESSYISKSLKENDYEIVDFNDLKNTLFYGVIPLIINFFIFEWFGADIKYSVPYEYKDLVYEIIRVYLPSFLLLYTIILLISSFIIPHVSENFKEKYLKPGSLFSLAFKVVILIFTINRLLNNESNSEVQENQFNLDTDGDGVADAYGVDMDGDGIIDNVSIDTDGDCIVDTIQYDTDGDGILDGEILDMDGDGKFGSLEDEIEDGFSN